MNNKDFDYCKEEFKWFLDAQYPNLKGDIDKQIEKFCKNFCFDDLRDIEKINALSLDSADKEKYLEYNYGSNYKDNTDCDDTHLARIIYFLIHNDNKINEYALPGLNKLTDIGSGYKYKYRGDTLNTYSTLFGSKNQGVVKYFNSPNDIKKINEYRQKYVTIGNFSLLPAATVRLNSDKQKWDSINSYRGTSEKYRDYFDLFLQAFIHKEDFVQWRNLDETKAYFDVMDNTNEFIKRNMLEKYFIEGTNKIIITTDFPYYWKTEENVDTKDYRKFALNYIDKATEIINHRAYEMTKILRQRLKG